MPSEETYYDILQVSRNATLSEIKVNYRRLAKQVCSRYHLEYIVDVKPVFCWEIKSAIELFLLNRIGGCMIVWSID